jgi:hypothetical protein
MGSKKTRGFRQRPRREIFVEPRPRILKPQRGGIFFAPESFVVGFENVSLVVINAELFQ